MTDGCITFTSTGKITAEPIPAETKVKIRTYGGGSNKAQSGYSYGYYITNGGERFILAIGGKGDGGSGGQSGGDFAVVGVRKNDGSDVLLIGAGGAGGQGMFGGKPGNGGGGVNSIGDIAGLGSNYNGFKGGNDGGSGGKGGYIGFSEGGSGVGGCNSGGGGGGYGEGGSGGHIGLGCGADGHTHGYGGGNGEDASDGPNGGGGSYIDINLMERYGGSNGVNSSAAKISICWGNEIENNVL